jgi:ribosomal protein L7Ae-like RNA K-turn-binding protein
VALDASQNSLDKISALFRARSIPVSDVFTASELGAMAGRESVAVIGVTDAGLAEGIKEAVS